MNSTGESSQDPPPSKIKENVSTVVFQHQDSTEENNNYVDSELERPHHRDEYEEDPLPGLVGNFASEEPDLENLEGSEFLLEDFEFTLNSDGEVEDDSDSSLEYFDITTDADLKGIRRGMMGADLPEVEKVSVELDQKDQEPGTGEKSTRRRWKWSDIVVNEPSTSKGSTLEQIREKAARIVIGMKGIVGKKRKNIRVLYHNLDKPYIVKISGSQHFKKYLTLGQEPNSTGMSTSSSINEMGPDMSGMTEEERAVARAEWQAELNLIEDEIQTLRQVLTAKTRRSHELKRKLGVTVWNEFTQDMNQGIKNVRESTAAKKIVEMQTAVTSAPLYQKTESAVKAAGEKTTSLFGGIGSAIGQKLGALKNTESFRSMEERVTGVVGGVKNKMGGSRSGSVQSFDEALREATQGTNPDGTPIVRPNGTNPDGSGADPNQPLS